VDTVVIAEMKNNELTTASSELVSAANLLGDNPTLIVYGTDPGSAASQASNIAGVGRVIALHDDCFSSYDSSSWSTSLGTVCPDGHVICSSSSRGKEVAARIAAMRETSIVQDVVQIEGNVVTHPIYSGKALESLSLDKESVVTIRANSFELSGGGNSAEISTINQSADVSTAIKDMIAKASERLDVTEANIIISGGRGMGSPDNFSHLDKVANVLGAAVGASRAAVDTWDQIPHSMQVGQTGKTVTPNLYIAVGISGAIQHLAGMRTSKYIVAINKDPDAPIFKHADYGIVSTWEDALPLLESELMNLLN